jgi:hypothetical protein
MRYRLGFNRPTAEDCILKQKNRDSAIAEVWLGLALTCSYSLVAMALVLAFL